MTHWFIRREERLYLYGKQGLHQLKANPQTARKLKEAVFGDRSANWMPVDEALAARLLPGEQRSASSGGNSDGTLTPRGEWQLRVITPDKALLLRYLTPGDELEITAAVEEGNPQWKSAMAQPLLLSYAESIAAACDGLQDEEAQAAKRVIQIDLGGAKTVVEPKRLLTDVLRTAVRETRSDPAEPAEAVDWTSCLDALERLENQLVHSFVYHGNDLLQIPYKIATASDGSYHSGEGNAEQIVRASCRNLERLLNQVHPGPPGEWLVTAGRQHRVERQAEQLFTAWEAVGGPAVLEGRKLAFAELAGNTRIQAMIRRFVPQAEQLEIYVERIPGVGAYRAAAGKAGSAWTDGCCASSQQEAIQAVLIRFYAQVQQNGIRVSSPYAADERMSAAPVEPPEQGLTEAFRDKYSSMELLIPVLENTGITILHVQRKEERGHEGSHVIPDGQSVSAGSCS
ncbi:hypothetical protein MKY64_02165 [Paenibacillus sp. FSL R7-0210]|uniref:hypothetical protein n=1 Tax=Paenibacillus sp. FSL R7-0210 TaxID=2921676 RepID=UPI0030F51D36